MFALVWHRPLRAEHAGRVRECPLCERQPRLTYRGWFFTYTSLSCVCGVAAPGSTSWPRNRFIDEDTAISRWNHLQERCYYKHSRELARNIVATKRKEKYRAG